MRYEEYKDSNISWLPMIPANWDVIRGKNLYNKENRAVRDSDETVTCFRDGEVTLRKNRRTEGFTESFKESGYQGVRKGDLVIHVMDAFAGAIGVSDSDGKGTPVYSVCTAKRDLNNYYYAYLLREMARTGFIQSLYRGIRERSSDFRFDIFAAQKYPVPPREEQDQIVRFLDWKVSRIDKLIHGYQKQIKLLEERRQTMISNAVMHGLNSNTGTGCEKYKELDETWLSQLPSHWETRKIKYQFDEISDKGHPDGVPLVASQHMGVVPKNVYGQRTVVANKGLELFKKVEIGDFVISLRSFQGGLEYAWYEGIISPAYTILRNKNPEYSDYYKYLFKSAPFIKLLTLCVTGIREGQNIDYQTLKQHFIPVPPHEEQDEIVEYIETQEKKYKTAIESTEKQIELLKEYRTRLISDVVTGQMDVRGIEIPEYEIEEDIAECQTGDEEDVEVSMDAD